MKKNRNVLVVSAVSENLIKIRKFLYRKMESHSFKTESIALFTLAVIEFCENIIKHGYKEKKGKIKIKIYFYKKVVKIIIIDTARPFDITEYKDINLKKRFQKGLGGKMGIKIIRLVCDEIYYKRRNNSNITTLIKYVK